MTRNIKILFVIFILGFTYSCAKKNTPENLVKLERKKDKELLDVMDSLKTIQPRTFYSKIATKYKDTTQSIGFKTSMRMVQDSAMNFIITYLGIAVANSVITNDTLTVVNKKDKCFIIQDLKYIKENFGVDFTFTNLEELFLGRPLDYDPEVKYFQINDNFNYIISSHRKRAAKKIDKKDLEEIVIKYYLRDDLKGIKRTIVESPSDSTTINIYYKEHQLVDNYLVPKEVYVTISGPNNNIVLELNYEKVAINEEQTLFLVIPEGYEACKD